MHSPNFFITLSAKSYIEFRRYTLTLQRRTLEKKLHQISTLHINVTAPNAHSVHRKYKNGRLRNHGTPPSCATQLANTMPPRGTMVYSSQRTERKSFNK